jgi:DNA topoisomerase-3
LVIAEKPSVGAALAAVLGAAKKNPDGYLEGNGYIVSWCVGHLVELADAAAYDEKYKKWRIEDLPIVPDVWKYVPSTGKSKQLKLLSELMKRKDVESLICATDAGREGELIFRLVYNHCNCKKKIERLWISSMEDAAIREGFAKLRPGAEYDGLYHAAMCRSQADFVVGINASRLYSCMYNARLSVGRVQSPTLAMLVARENAIRDFVKTPYYSVLLNCGTFTASSEKMPEKGEAERIRALCDGKRAVVASIESKEKSAAPPKLYDLTSLQRDANRIYGYTAQQTLDTAQKLYEARLLTYPRTDSNYITEDMAKSAESLTSRAALLLPYIKVPIPVSVGQIVNGKKVSDHHALLPTETALKEKLESLPPMERDILTLVVVRLIESVGNKHVYRDTKVRVLCEEQKFTANGRVILNDGWRAIDDKFKAALKTEKDEAAEDERALPALEQGQIFSPVKTSVKEGFTTPPKHFTEDTLLAAMETAGAEDMPEDAERKGLGTPATRAAILEKLIKTGFVERRKKNLLPTAKGESLIVVLPENLKSPKLTAEWEHWLKEVERNERDAEDFMAGITGMVQLLVDKNKEYLSAVGRPENGALFSDETTAPKDRESLGICPRCGKNIIDIGKGYGCEDRACKFVIWKENKYFSSKKKKVTKEIVKALLTEGRVFIKGLYSERTKKTYDATIVLDDTGGDYVNFKMDFEDAGGKGAAKKGR